MRKALIGIVLAATMMTPVAAEAQRRGGDRSEQHGSDGGEARSERVQQHHQQREARVAEQPQVQQQQVEQPPQAPVVQVVQRNNDGNRGGNRGGGGDGNRGGNRGGGDNNRGGNDGNNGGNDGNRGGNRGDWNRGGNNGGNDGNRGGNRGTQTSAYPQAWQGNPNDPQLRRYQELERRNQQQGYRRGSDRNDNGRNWNNNGRNDGRNGSWNGRGDGRRGDWNRGWRNDNRYNWQYHRRANRNFYHVGPYYSPYRNYRYNRFSVGLFLDALFYDQRYWIGDPWQYRLPPAPYGTQWVRYYNDVMLIDVYTGEVVDVIHDFFW